MRSEANRHNSTVTYSGSIDATGDSLIALYGWTTSPLVEYYVIETYGTYNPGSAGTHKGTVTSDGATYDIYEAVRSNAPSIQGTQTFNQYLSIRQSKRTSGTITFQNHITAWKKLGLVSDHWDTLMPSRGGGDGLLSNSLRTMWTLLTLPCRILGHITIRS